MNSKQTIIQKETKKTVNVHIDRYGKIKTNFINKNNYKKQKKNERQMKGRLYIMLNYI